MTSLDLDHLLARNRAWARRVTESDPDAFRRLADGQSPKVLWIGCSDSRVSATQVIDQPPGRVFVHRNIGNVVAPSDLNCMSVLHYAVEVLQVGHVVVCGHYGCGAVQASLADRVHGPIDEWLDYVRHVRREHRDELAGLGGMALERRLVELNVVAQMRNVAATDVLRRARKAGRAPALHGWVYEVADGLLRTVC